jgi:hypothetical protein
MNPYDFARIDWERPPERHKPVWHHRLTGDQPLYSGTLDLDIYAETPLFLADPRGVSSDPRKPAQSMRNAQGAYIIPGSSLKGLLRTVVETLGNGCLTLFDGDYERGRIRYRENVPFAFLHCEKNTQLCIACRIFGMLKERTGGVFLGKVNIGDAEADPEKSFLYNPMYTAVLVEPKPRHAAFYLDEDRKYIAGRKFYFHHSPDYEPLSASRPIFFGDRLANRFIQPLDYDTLFHARLDFTNLEASEFGVLLLAIILEEGMRHKIGYGKPLGLGSIQLAPTRLTLIDYAVRYSQPSDPERGKTTFDGADMWNRFNQFIDIFTQSHLSSPAFTDLRRIWHWPPEPDVEYYYPSKREWFDTAASRGKRIADTRNVP